ncbi:MAG: YbaN family protein [Pseudomonadales bacterium]|nr:YbaN family protein [Pseudomonadales bacterium]MBO6565920.1 YbaN family protein [Pseudomonadales bacterium]MBO6595297.1 YbaN family protein [Pseudomonadales bacterium]MBO6821144.1 YbaN family protein [Pseudomonadales bacterium]
MKRFLLLGAGFISLGLGALGAVLPVLPTTPFLLLAAGCFAQSSNRWHQWLLNNRYAGPMIKDWEENRCVSWKTKIVALTSMVVVGGLSVTLALDVMLHRAVAIALMGLGAITVLSLPTCPATSDAPAQTDFYKQ